MLIFKKIFISAILFFFYGTYAFSDDKIAYINMDKILSQTNASKIIFKELKKKETLIIEDLNNKEKNFKDEENKILSNKNILSKEKYDEKVVIFKKKLFEYKKDKEQILNELKKERNNQIVNFINKINPLIENFMNTNSIGILIEKKSVFISKPNYDITNDIIDLINEKIKP